MKIEVCEQLACAWLRYVKECQVVQTNWTPSPDEGLYVGHSKIEEIVNLCQDALGEDYERTFKKSTPTQIFNQCEIDVIGVRLEGKTVESVYLVDTAFHVGGLGYRDNEARVTKKILRAALVAAVVFPDSPLHIIFATPKARPKDVSDLNKVGDVLRTLFSERSMDVEISIFMNGSFASEMLSPLVQKSSRISDSNMLFLRALQLCHLSHFLTDPSDGGAVGRRRVAQLLQASWRPEVLGNRDEVPEREEEPVDDDGEELTPEELEALRSLAEVRLDDLVAQDTETAEAALTEAVEGASDEDAAADDELENRTYKRDRNGQFASTGAAQHSPRHSRASKGNPKNPTTQSNTPLKAAPGARPQEKVDAMARSIKRTAEHGGTVRDVAKVGDKMMTVPHGRAGRKNDRYAGGYGTAHQQSKHGKKRRCHSAESGKGNGVRPETQRYRDR